MTLALVRGVAPVVAGRAVPRPLAVRMLRSRHPRPLLREALWLAVAPLLRRRPARREELPQVGHADSSAAAAAPAAVHLVGRRALAVARDAQREAAAFNDHLLLRPQQLVAEVCVGEPDHGRAAVAVHGDAGDLRVQLVTAGVV